MMDNLKICIAKDYDGNVISVVLAKSIESATSYWQGTGLPVHSSYSPDEELIKENAKLGYVCPILKMKQARFQVPGGSYKEVKVWVEDKR